MADVASTQGSRGAVDIVRDFMLVHRALEDLIGRFRSGQVEFADIATLVSDGDASLLFRLKEHCHAQFRSSGGTRVGREVLFDLAVGALFHDAMKLRESLYQQTVYGPKVRALKRASDPETESLFQAFEALLHAGAERLGEGFTELETLLGRTRVEFEALLVASRDDGYVARFLIENPSLVEEVFGYGLDDLLTSIHGELGSGQEIAARSYLASGHFARAAAAYREAVERLGPSERLDRPRAYAAGMQAFLEGRYADMVEQLGLWLDADGPVGESALAEIAHASASRVEQLVGDADDPVAASASVIAERLREHVAASAPVSALRI